MPSFKQLVILAGGQGTRLRSVLGDKPKPMAEVGGIPVLEHQVLNAKRYGFDDVLFLTSYQSDMIESYFGDGSHWGVRFRYVLDPGQLGTAGATLAASDFLQDRFILLYGDVMHDVNLQKLWDFHEAGKADASLFVHPNDHPQDSDVVEFGSDGIISGFHGYPHPEGSNYRNMVNAGMYVLDRAALHGFTGKSEKLDFGKDVFPAMIATGMKLAAYPSREYIKDMGTPARLEKVDKDYRSGRIASLNLSNPVPAVFLDRDGTLVKLMPWLSRPEDVTLEKDAAKAVKKLNASSYLAILTTNQPVIARGECSFADLERIHGRMEILLAEEDKAHLDAIYFCPHHPHSGYDGEVVELKIDCACRKPRPGMFEAAAKEHNIDLANSWIVGDSTCDLEAARRLGIRSILVSTGEAGKDAKYPTEAMMTAANVLEAVSMITETGPSDFQPVSCGSPNL